MLKGRKVCVLSLVSGCGLGRARVFKFVALEWWRGVTSCGVDSYSSVLVAGSLGYLLAVAGCWSLLYRPGFFFVLLGKKPWARVV